jgi:murein DD-endopeptidase MepM/ murein hydrolase activator NlpD
MGKRLLFIAVLAAIAIGWYNNQGPGTAAVSRVAGHLMVPYRILQLSSRPPDASLLMPVPDTAVRRIANTWHAPRPGERKHQGQDIFAPRGTPVRSATQGLVLRVGTNTLGGRIVSVLGPGRRTYYYAHLDRHAEDVHAGDFIERGIVIGYVGTTGNARTTQPHLHFGVYTSTGAIDPLPLLQADAM